MYSDPHSKKVCNVKGSLEMWLKLVIINLGFFLKRALELQKMPNMKLPGGDFARADWKVH